MKDFEKKSKGRSPYGKSNEGLTGNGSISKGNWSY